MKTRPKTKAEMNRDGRGLGKKMDRMSNIRRRSGTATVAEKAVLLDYPQEGEVVSSKEYAFRIGAPESAEGIEVSINSGPWHACRKASGHWWYDWSEYGSGGYEAVARIRPQNGENTATEIQSFLVELPE